MKIRNGFVSNSSSSSFVIVVPSEIHSKVLSEIDDNFITSVINEISKESKFNGNDVVTVVFESDGYYPDLDVFDWEEEDTGGIDSINEAFYAYEEMLRKHKEDIILVQMDN